MAKIAALAAAAGLAFAFQSFPLRSLPLAAALGGYAAVLWWRPQLWLLLLPALLPVFDLAPWSGWFYLDELDLLLLATVAAGYWRLERMAPAAELPPFAALALGLVTLAWIGAGAIGLWPFAPPDANAFASYASHYNSLRVAKGLLWALALLPLLRRSAGAGLSSLRRLFVPGMLLGLLFTALAVIWERTLFPGLLNFSSDYRPTAPFSAMHTGGAALDAYLALSFPFVALWLLDTASPRRLAAALALLLLGLFAGFATFSRDVYLAYGVSALVLAVLLAGSRLRRGELSRRVPAATALLLAVAAYVLTQVFASGGYRALAASLVLLAAAVVLGAADSRPRAAWPAALAALALVLLDLALYFALRDRELPGVLKGPYLAFMLSAGVFGLGLAMLLSGASRQSGLGWVAAAFPGTALSAVLVARHWGGTPAAADVALVIVLAVALIALNRTLPQPLWRLNRGTLVLGFFAAIVFAIVIPIAGSYYTGARFATVAGDWNLRVRHWREALNMMTPDWHTRLFGMGLGRYPDTYRWKNTSGEMPGSFSYETDNAGEHGKFLRLISPYYPNGYGEVLRTLQHVRLTPGARYRLALDVRSSQPKAQLTVAICERWLLYAQNCVSPGLRLAEGAGVWRRYELELDAGPLGRSVGPVPVPTQLEIWSESPNTYLDIDNLSLRDEAGAELIGNGSFSDGNSFWFFSSDRDHLPWHVKNFFVNTYFEQGWFGSAATALLLLCAGCTLAARGWRGNSAAAVCLAALAGGLVVGMFDSLFDVPRLTLLFFMLVLAGLLRPVRAAARRPPKRRGRARKALEQEA